MDETRRDGALAQRREVHAGAVVADGDADRVLLAGRLDEQAADFRLARGDAHLRRLEAVVDRVAHQVDERIVEAVEDRAVELELGARERDLHALADARGHLACDTRQVLHHAQQRRGAQRERASLEFADDAVHLVEAAREARVLTDAVGLGGGAQLAGGEDHLADRAEEAVERLVRHPHGGRRTRHGLAHGLDGRAGGRCARRSFDYGRRWAFFAGGAPPRAASNSSSGGGGSPVSRTTATMRSRLSRPRNSTDDALRIVDSAALAPSSETVLEAMGEGAHGVVAERRTHALHRVHHAEHEIERRPVAWILLESQQRLAHLGQMLGRLFEEEGPVLGEIH